MSKEWVEIFDKATAGDRGKDIDVQQVARDYDPQKVAAPAILGHSTSYSADTRIPVGSWVEGLKAQGTKLLAKFKSPGTINVPVPAMFQELAKMPEFFKQAVNNKLYSKHSSAFLPVGDGKHQFHHVAFLGATLPECKGMPDIVFNEHPDFKLLTVEFSSTGDTIIEFTEEDTIMKPDFLSILTQFAALGTDKIKTFAELDPAKLTDEDLSALSDLVPLLKSILGINDSATIQEVLGALKVRESDFKKLQEALAAVGSVAVTPGSSVSSFAEITKLMASLKEFSEPKAPAPTTTDAKLDALILQFADLSKKLKEFEENPPAPTPPAGGGELKIETLGKSEEDCKKAAETAKQQLVDKKNWIPAYDESLMPLMVIAANVKVGEGSGLDKLVAALGAIEGLNEMSQILERYKIIELSEQMRQYGKDKSPDQPFLVPAGTDIGNLEQRNQIKEFAAKHNKSFVDARNEMVSAGLIVID